MRKESGSSELFLILGCMTSSILYLSFSTLYFGSFWKIDTLVFAELSKPPCLYEGPPQMGLK